MTNYILVACMALNGKLAKEEAIIIELEDIKFFNGKLFVCTSNGIYHLGKWGL